MSAVIAPQASRDTERHRPTHRGRKRPHSRSEEPPTTEASKICQKSARSELTHAPKEKPDRQRRPGKGARSELTHAVETISDGPSEQPDRQRRPGKDAPPPSGFVATTVPPLQTGGVSPTATRNPEPTRRDTLRDGVAGLSVSPYKEVRFVPQRPRGGYLVDPSNFSAHTLKGLKLATTCTLEDPDTLPIGNMSQLYLRHPSAVKYQRLALYAGIGVDVEAGRRAGFMCKCGAESSALGSSTPTPG